MTSLVTFTSAPAILGGKKSCSALSAALTYGTVARLQLLRARQQERIASETPGERAARLQHLRARQQQQFASETPQETAARRQRDREAHSYRHRLPLHSLFSTSQLYKPG